MGADLREAVRRPFFPPSQVSPLGGHLVCFSSPSSGPPRGRLPAVAGPRAVFLLSRWDCHRGPRRAGAKGFFLPWGGGLLGLVGGEVFIQSSGAVFLKSSRYGSKRDELPNAMSFLAIQ